MGVEFDGCRGHLLTHRSYAFERGWTVTNERLEFPGATRCSLAFVTDLAFRAFPDPPGGCELAKFRAAHGEHDDPRWRDVAADRGLGDLARCSAGARNSGDEGDKALHPRPTNGGRARRGLPSTAGSTWRPSLIVRLFQPRMDAYARGEGDRDYKTVLQELSAQEVGSVPDYRVAAAGPIT